MTKDQNTEWIAHQKVTRYACEYFGEENNEPEEPSEVVDVSGNRLSARLIPGECTEVVELTPSGRTSEGEPHLLVLTTVDEASKVCQYFKGKFEAEKVSVVYVDEGVIMLCQPVSWLGWLGKNTPIKRYEAAMQTFVWSMTVEASGETIDFDTVHQLFQRWYGICSGGETPSTVWIGRVAHAVTDIRRKPQKKVLHNRKWRHTL